MKTKRILSALTGVLLCSNSAQAGIFPFNPDPRFNEFGEQVDRNFGTFSGCHPDPRAGKARHISIVDVGNVNLMAELHCYFSSGGEMNGFVELNGKINCVLGDGPAFMWRCDWVSESKVVVQGGFYPSENVEQLWLQIQRGLQDTIEVSESSILP